MSHTVKAQVEYKEAELKNLIRAFKDLGWEIEENTKMKTYSSSGADADKVYQYVARNPQKTGNAYDVGLQLKDGKWELFTDFYGGSVASSLGDEFDRLTKQFAGNVIKDEYSGWGNVEVSQEWDNETGDLVLNLTGFEGV